MIGARSLSSERDRATWPLLAVTGMRPGRILAGKFATSCYALSGEWVWTLPFWVGCALATKSPSLLLLPWIQPLAIATGVIVGLWVASQPKVRVGWAPIAAVALVGLAGLVAVVLPVPTVDLSAFDPVPVVEQLAVGRLDLAGFGIISLWVASWLACFGVGWTWTGLCLRRVMRCD